MLNNYNPTNPTFTNVPVRSKSKTGKWILALLTIILIAVLVYLSYSYKNVWFGNEIKPNATAYQAVFLTNGQVYFGKLETHGGWIILRDVYYLQATQDLQSTQASTSTTVQPNIQLIKLGSELHGPEDVMSVVKENVLFWENMKDDSKVMQAIKKYQEGKK